MIEVALVIALAQAEVNQEALLARSLKPVVQAQVDSPDFNTDYVIPIKNRQPEIEAMLRAKEEARKKAACEADGGTYNGTCVYPPLRGSYGYAKAFGNCVDLAKAYGKNQPGNPIGWYATTRQPFIGAAALFYYNHVGIVRGIYSDGSVEIAHANYSGTQTRFYPSEIRGYF